jgi:hypothetical protein
MVIALFSLAGILLLSSMYIGIYRFSKLDYLSPYWLATDYDRLVQNMFWGGQFYH